ncbi:hypothetical protein, partial [Mycolicibacterium mengxianglii]|uniref:hypothetical protein n=1 Tax=Mycolicibacterium mengxianglii TaxID=2736649 RepID=UPI001E54F2AF
MAIDGYEAVNRTAMSFRRMATPKKTPRGGGVSLVGGVLLDVDVDSFGGFGCELAVVAGVALVVL